MDTRFVGFQRFGFCPKKLLLEHQVMHPRQHEAGQLSNPKEWTNTNFDPIFWRKIPNCFKETYTIIHTSIQTENKVDFCSSQANMCVLVCFSVLKGYIWLVSIRIAGKHPGNFATYKKVGFSLSSLRCWPVVHQQKPPSWPTRLAGFGSGRPVEIRLRQLMDLVVTWVVGCSLQS